MMTQQTTSPVYFKLKDAKEYGFWGRANQRRLLVKFGEVIAMTTKADIDFFRSRKDVMVECTPDGVPTDEEGRKGHLIPGKPKTFRTFGRQAPKPVAVPKPAPRVMQVGNPPVQPIAAALPLVEAPKEDGPKIPTIRPGLTPGIPTIQTHAKVSISSATPGQALPGVATISNVDISPIEFAAPDGSTEDVRSGVDPSV